MDAAGRASAFTSPGGAPGAGIVPSGGSSSLFAQFEMLVDGLPDRRHFHGFPSLAGKPKEGLCPCLDGVPGAALTALRDQADKHRAALLSLKATGGATDERGTAPNTVKRGSCMA